MSWPPPFSALHLQPFIQMRETCLRCPFSFGYPSEQSLWTAYPFTAINNSPSLSSHSPPHNTSPFHPHPTTTSPVTRASSSRAICCLGLLSGALPAFSLLSVDLVSLQRLQFITRQARPSALSFASSLCMPHIHETPPCFQTVADFTAGQPFYCKTCLLYALLADIWSKI